MAESFPTLLDLHLHNLSIEIGGVWKVLYRDDKYNCDHALMEDLLTAYRCTRRHISKNPKTGERYGAKEAGRLMSGQIPTEE